MTHPNAWLSVENKRYAWTPYLPAWYPTYPHVEKLPTIQRCFSINFLVLFSNVLKVSRALLTPFEHVDSIVQRGLRGTLNCYPIMPRGVNFTGNLLKFSQCGQILQDVSHCFDLYSEIWISDCLANWKEYECNGNFV